MNKLTCLGLYNNKSLSLIPTEIGFLHSLMAIDLQVKMMTGSLPADLGNLTQLTKLSVAPSPFKVFFQ